MQSTSKLLTVIRSIFPVSSRHIGASACAAAAAGETNQPSGGGRRDARKGGGGAMNVFDRHAKKLQKARAAVAEDAHLYDYLKDHVAETIAERVGDIDRFFPRALDVGCGRGHFAKALTGDLVGSLDQCDMSRHVLDTASVIPGGVVTHNHEVDEEQGLPFEDDTFDLAVSSLSLHWVNDLPGVMREVKRVIKPDAPFIGVMFTEDTLFELRSSLQVAETEKFGGFSPHVSPFVLMQDLGSLLNQAGYALTTLDTDEVVIRFPSMMELLRDLKGMGESNCAWTRPLLVRREALKAATQVYREMYGSDDSVPATFQLLYFIGWKPHPSQSQPLARGSATTSFRDLATVAREYAASHPGASAGNKDNKTPPTE